MGLRERLDRLTGSGSPPPVAGESLASRLARLRPSGAGSTVRAGRGPDEQALVESLAAERLAPGLLYREQQLSGDERQGEVALADGLAALPQLMCTCPGDPLGWQFLDSETSGLSGGTGTWVFQVGMLRPVADGWRLRQYLLARLDAEPVFLEAIAAELSDARLLVTYNGKTFDRPLLATRFRLAGLADPLVELPHLDLLARVRRAFTGIWPDCRLASAEERLLGLRRLGDLPGAAAPQAWLAWLRQGHIAPLDAVLRHNRWDLLSLAALPKPLAITYANPAATGAAVQAVAAHHIASGMPERALSILCDNLDRLPAGGRLMLADLHRRRGDWDAAYPIWAALAERDEPLALEALAKYHEHRRGDFVTALRLAERLPPGAEQQRRCARLAAKLARRTTAPGRHESAS